MPTVFDIVAKGQPGYEGHLSWILDHTRDDPHRNTQNLRHLAERDYEAVFIVVDEGTPAAVAAVEDFSRDNVCLKRVLTRTWYRDDHRQPGLRTRVKPGVILRVLMPPQIEHCIAVGADAAFISTETPRRRAPLASFAENLTAEWPQWPWRLDEWLRFTCKHEAGTWRRECWQNVAVLDLKGRVDLPLPRMPVEDYWRTFS